MEAILNREIIISSDKYYKSTHLLSEMKEWFYFFDKNGDEKLDIKELDNVFHALCWDLTKDELEEVMKDADTDGKGC